jgi:hypothetical protein
VIDSPISTRLVAPLLVALGLAMIVRTIVEGGGPFSVGIIFGVLFLVLGGLRLYAAVLRRRGSSDA